ncbi:MAG: hypothetical protein ABI723_12940 [Bacteroidia bacterium]
MKYFFPNIKDYFIEEVTEDEYANLTTIFGQQFKFQFGRVVGLKRYSFDTLFMGAVDNYEELLPYIIYTFKDEIQPNADGVTWVNITHEIEYYATHEEFISRIEQLKSKIIGLKKEEE